MGGTRSHWDSVYTSKSENEVSWYQTRPERSLELIEAAAPDRAAAVVDIGGGASTLVDGLLASGYRDVTVLDVADAALARSRARLGGAAAGVDWVVADITQWQPPRRYDVWHDRAVFHFLTEAAQQDAYLAALAAGTQPGSVVVMATFALDGPERCSGLPVQRYSAETMAARLGARYVLADQAADTHRTPWGAGQRFCYGVFRRTG